MARGARHPRVDGRASPGSLGWGPQGPVLRCSLGRTGGLRGRPALAPQGRLSCLCWGSVQMPGLAGGKVLLLQKHWKGLRSSDLSQNSLPRTHLHPADAEAEA